MGAPTLKAEDRGEAKAEAAGLWQGLEARSPVGGDDGDVARLRVAPTR
jgi:hypothetical protein